MTPEFVTGLFLEAIKTAILLSGPMLCIGLLVGILVSMFQAATQINEMTLVFVPKMLAVGVVYLALFHHVMIDSDKDNLVSKVDILNQPQSGI